jgi:hypothetical protein
MRCALISCLINTSRCQGYAGMKRIML